MTFAIRFRQTLPVPRQSGEHARLKVVAGPDAGAVYVLTGPRVVIGRGEDTDVKLGDLKASRRHAELFRTPKGWMIRDLGSSNGITHRGEEKRETMLQGVDTLSLGETVFEFVDAGIPDQQLVAAPKSHLDLLKAESALEQQRDRVRALGRAPKAGSVASSPKQRMQMPKSGPRALLVPAMLGLLGYLYFGLDSSEDQKKADAQKKAAAKKSAAPAAPTPNRDLASFYGSIQDSPEASRQADSFFKSGFREFREKNYLRARMNFENVLQVSPGHQLARVYLSKSTQAIDEQVVSHLELGKRSLDSGKLRSAKGHFESVMRLLHRDPSHPRYEEARLQLEKTQSALKGAPSS